MLATPMGGTIAAYIVKEYGLAWGLREVNRVVCKGRRPLGVSH